ncbi:LamG domain-containing protein [Sporomusa sphaeroides]|uniref:LamG-like jellyroll fold domain-containing protein n=1 Tax=Sporomusa sphaeroides TaxID=47679 RepID=UPI003DA12002
MPVLPKRPSLLMHFDDNLVDTTKDIVQNVVPSGTIGNIAYFKNKDSIAGETFFFDGTKQIRCNGNSSGIDMSGSFTFSLWEFLFTDSPIYGCSCNLSAPANGYGTLFGYLNANRTQKSLYCSSNGSTWNQINGYSLGAPIYNEWTHWEVGYDKPNKQLYVFKNGTLLNVFTLTADPYYNPSGTGAYNSIGGYNTYNSMGLIADFSFTAGICEHISDFAPVQPTSTKITKALHPMITDVESKFGGGALYLNGANYISTSLDSLVVDTARDFTVGFWEYLISATANAASFVINSNNTTSSGSAAVLLGYNYSNNKNLYASTGGSSWNVASLVALEPISNLLNRWAHWEVCYQESSRTLFVFLDGILKHSVVCPGPLRIAAPNYSYLGRWGSYTQAAYYDELLILPGVCLYTDNFTPPTEPYSAPNETLQGISLQALPYNIEREFTGTGQNLHLTQGTATAETSRGTMLRLTSGTAAAKHSQGETLKPISGGDWQPENFWGKPIQSLQYSNQIAVPETTGVGMFLAAGSKDLAQYPGRMTNWLYRDSNEGYQFDLLVTPTHIYKNQIAQVTAKYKLPQGLTGKYQLKIKDGVAIPWGDSNADLSTVQLSVMQSMLDYGKNLCRLEYLYLDGQIKFLDFEVTREEPRRTRVERTFKRYDGGYDGNYMRSAPNGLEKAPCFLVPDGQQSTVIKTTDFTKVPLQKYTGVQGVLIDAEGARILVTFDEGLTWKALIEDSWQTVSLGSITTSGMTSELVNSTIFARWLEIFQPVSLDFAIYLDNSVSNYADRFGEYLATTAYVASGNGTKKSTTYTANSDVWITKIFASGGANDHDKTVDSYTNGVWQEEARVNYGSGSTHTVDFIERQNKPSAIRINAKYSLYAQVYVSPKLAYLKSIVADITPRLKTGYAFIM